MTEKGVTTILVVDDDETHGASVAAALAACPATVRRAVTVRDAIRAIEERAPDLVVLDLGLPDGEGIDVLRRVRSAGTAPVLVYSGRGEEAEKIALLEAGADDFVTKPVGPDELLARVRAQLRRASLPPAAEVLRVDGAEIDFSAGVVRRDGRERRLTPTETALLRVLAGNRGRTMTHGELWSAVWGREFGDAQLHLRVHVTHLRRKVERQPAVPRLIVTEPGVGYRFEAP